jgi:hypothetical protein
VRTSLGIAGIFAPLLTADAGPAASADHDNLTYESSGSSDKITGYISKPVGVLSIPRTINGQDVTAIAASAFTDCNGLGSVIIPDTVSSIDALAFAECSNLGKESASR